MVQPFIAVALAMLGVVTQTIGMYRNGWTKNRTIFFTKFLETLKLIAPLALSGFRQKKILGFF